jgi:transposase
MRSELDAKMDVLDEAVATAAEKDARARLLMTQPGVGPITSMAFVLTIGDVSRFPRGKQVASYLGLIPREYSSGGHQRLGAISKQGNSFLRMLLVEAAQGAVRSQQRHGEVLLDNAFSLIEGHPSCCLWFEVVV